MDMRSGPTREADWPETAPEDTYEDEGFDDFDAESTRLPTEHLSYGAGWRRRVRRRDQRSQGPSPPYPRLCRSTGSTPTERPRGVRGLRSLLASRGVQRTTANSSTSTHGRPVVPTTNT